MTYLECLIATRDMWQWLANHPTKTKPQYFKSGDKIPEHFCYCCQYVVDKTQGDGFMNCCASTNSGFASMIVHCPLKTLWPNGCESTDSPYHKWNNTISMFANRETSAQYAQQIADHCQKLIDEEGPQD